MTSREQFEAWFKPRKERMKNDGICTLNIVRYRGMAWAGWQASREAVEVDLPQPEPDGGTDSQVDISAGFSNRMRSKCIESIRAAGIKVKGE